MVKNKQNIGPLSKTLTSQKILAGIVIDNKFLKIFKIGKNRFWFHSKTGRCFFCTDKTRKKQGNFCDRYCQGFYENQESHRKLRMDIWNGKETRDYEAVESNLLDKVVKMIPGEVWRAKRGSFSLYDIYTEEELKEKPLNDQRLQIIRKIHAYMIKESREFLYCFAPKCSKRFEATPQTFSPFFCSKECVKKQQAMMKSREWREEQEKTEKWYKEHEIKVKEIKERRLLRAYGYSSQEDLPNFRRLFGGEVTEEKMEEFFKLAKKLV